MYAIRSYYERAQRIHLAMQCRGFDGEIRMRKPLGIRSRDLVFLFGWAAFFAAARTWNLPQQLGSLFLEFFA